MIDTIRPFDPSAPQAEDTAIGARSHATADRWRAKAAEQDAALKQRVADMMVQPKQKKRLTPAPPEWLTTPAPQPAPAKSQSPAADSARSNHFMRRPARKARTL